MRVRKIFLISVVATFTFIWLAAFLYLRNPIVGSGHSLASDIRADAGTLERHVRYLSELNPPRDHTHPAGMEAAENYIRTELKTQGYIVESQDVYAHDKTYRNIIVRYPNESAGKEILVVGAHYDVCGTDNPGADDNASGVAGLLEFTRLLQVHKPQTKYPLEIVFYTLEEPPFFGGAEMGSAVHAAELHKNNYNVKLMVSLEMIGYYSDEAFTQLLPIPLLYGMYPWTGNFIGVVGSPADRKVTREFKRSMIANNEVRTLSINAPAILPGVDFSDHRNYWAYDWPALMITDTAFLRNRQYHEPGDTADRLNYSKMAEVVRGVFAGVTQFE